MKTTSGFPSSVMCRLEKKNKKKKNRMFDTIKLDLPPSTHLTKQKRKRKYLLKKSWNHNTYKKAMAMRSCVFQLQMVVSMLEENFMQCQKCISVYCNDSFVYMSGNFLLVRKWLELTLRYPEPYRWMCEREAVGGHCSIEYI